MFKKTTKKFIVLYSALTIITFLFKTMHDHSQTKKKNGVNTSKQKKEQLVGNNG